MPKTKKELSQFELDLIELKLKGVTGIVIEYSGSGDSGDVESVSLEPIEIEDNTFIALYREALEQVALDYLSAEGINWYNDDGGQGTVKIDLIRNRVVMAHEENVRDIKEHNSDEKLSFAVEKVNEHLLKPKEEISYTDILTQTPN